MSSDKKLSCENGLRRISSALEEPVDGALEEDVEGEPDALEEYEAVDETPRPDTNSPSGCYR